MLKIQPLDTHLSMQHCFHVVFYISKVHITCMLGVLEKRELLENLCLMVMISNIIIKCGAHAQNSKSPFYFIFFLAVDLNQNVDSNKI